MIWRGTGPCVHVHTRTPVCLSGRALPDRSTGEEPLSGDRATGRLSPEDPVREGAGRKGQDKTRTGAAVKERPRASGVKVRRVRRLPAAGLGGQVYSSVVAQTGSGSYVR